MLGVVRCAARSLSRGGGEAMLGGEAVLRRLAARSAADVSGHLRLMGAGDKGALARLGSLRHDLTNPDTALPKTCALKPTDRGRLIEFVNAVEAAPVLAG